jgi:hypothetical protein
MPPNSSWRRPWAARRQSGGERDPFGRPPVHEIAEALLNPTVATVAGADHFEFLAG